MRTGRGPQQLVTAFHERMGIPVATEPTMLTAERGELRCRLIEEEAREFRDATEQGDWLEMVDALVDLLYVTFGTAVEMGVDLTPFFDEVHAANMRKLPAAGGGKSLKPVDWQEPDHARVYKDFYGAKAVPDRLPVS